MEAGYKPFQPTPESYINSREQTLARILGAFNDVLGIPPAIIKKDFRALLEKTVSNIHPKYRCSSARAVVENRLPGIAKLIDGLPISLKGRVNRALALLDLLETLVEQELAKETKSLMNEAATEAKRLKDVFGTNKVVSETPEPVVEIPAVSKIQQTKQRRAKK